MPRDPTLLAWLLPLCVAGTPVVAAGLGDTAGREAQSQWSSEAARPPLPLPPPVSPRPAAPSERPKFILQAQSDGGPAPPPAARPTTGVPDAAIQAEMEKRWDDAERIYNDLLLKEPARVDILLRLVDVLAAQGKKLPAAQALGRAADQRRDDAELQLHASEAFAAADQPKNALRYVDRALAGRPNDLGLQRRRAQVATWAGDYPKAVESLKALADADPGDFKVRHDLAQVLGWQGHPEEAVKILSEYATGHPSDKEALLDLARAQSANGDSDAAQASLQRFRDAGGDEATYQRELAKVQSDVNAPIKAEMEKRFGDAERMYREMLAREPGRTDLVLRLVDVLAAENKVADAAEMMAKAADLKPDDADLQLRASEAASAAAKQADALKYLNRAIALRPADKGLEQRRAQLSTWGGNYPEAEKSLRSLVQADPGDVTLKRDLGRVLMWQHKYPEAATLLSQYLAAHPDDKEVLLDLAQIQTARRDFKAAAETLKRYRAAGGDEATYRHELARGVAPRRAPAAGRAAGGGPAGAAAAGSIPADVVKAEAAKRYGEAERLLRGYLARQPQRVDLLLRLVNVLAAEKKGLAAAQTLAQAADLRPNDGQLQLRASEAFAAVDRPLDALRYVDRAVALRPNDPALHKRRVQTANWAGEYAEAEASLRILIAADPADLTLRRDLGRVIGWQHRSNEAAEILWDYVAQRPDDKEALLELSRIEAGRGGSQTAAELLERYRAAGGDELTYYHELALVLGWGGRLYSALAITEAGLARDPNDFSYRFAHGVVLQNGYESGMALQDVERLRTQRPNAPEIAGLQRTIDVSLRPYLQIDSSGYSESDHITIQTNEISYHQPLNDTWWLFAGGTTNYLDARTGSGFAPIQGGHDMWRGAGYVGTQARLSFGTIATARVGATGSGRGSTKPTWQVTADSKLSDDLRLQLFNARDYYIVSPRTLSLGITRIDTEGQLTYTPDMNWTVVTTAREAELSDNNRYLRGYIAPRRAVLRDQYWNIDFGVSGAWSGYSLKPLHGYYSPSFYQRYETNTYVYYKISDEDGVSVVASLGAQKDETFHGNFKLSAGLFTEATFGQLSDWMWKIRGGYTNNGSAQGPTFSSEVVGVTLVKRF